MPRGLLARLGGDGADAVGPSCDHLDGLAGRQIAAPYQRAKRRLIVLGIDRIGDQPGLGAVELVGGDAVLDDVGEHGVDAVFDLRAASRRASATP